MRLGHEVVPFVMEVFGGVDRDGMDLLAAWSARARARTPPGEEPPWSARNFIPYWSQILSKEAQRGAAREILDRVSEEVAAREASRVRGGD